MKYKKCTQCGKYKTVNNYTKHSSNADKLNNRCKDCIREYVQSTPSVMEARKKAVERWIKKNKTKFSEYQKAYRIRKKYGISADEYRKIIAKADGHCQSCERSSEKLLLKRIDDSEEFVNYVLCPRCMRKRMFKN